MESSWIDITRPLQEDMTVFSGHAPFRLTRVADIKKDGYSLSKFSMGSHCGTHMDAPAHFVPNCASIDQLPLELVIGETLLIGVASDEDLNRVPDGTRRLLIRAEGFAGLTVEDARLLIDKGVRLMGIDRLCVAREDMDASVHQELLSSGAWILESLLLSGAPEGRYFLCCLPLRIAGGEGAPARAVIRPLS